MSELADRERSARQRWAKPGSGYDSVVRWMQRITPMGIGALAAILVVTPIATAQTESSFLLDKEEINLAKERMRLTSASYSGRDSEGRLFLLTAGSAVQLTSEDPIVRVKDVVAEMAMATGPAKIEAKEAVYNLETELVSVVGPVTYKSADGYQLAMNNVAINMKTRQVQGLGAAQGSAPQGNLAGNAVNADLKTKNVTISGGVSGSGNAGSFSGGALQGNLDSKQVSVTGGVKGTTGSGSFSGGALQGNLASKQFGVSGGVSGSTRLGTFAGSGLNADLNARRVSIFGGVTGRTRFGTYSADTMTVDENRRTLVLQGRARLTLYPRGL